MLEKLMIRMNRCDEMSVPVKWNQGGYNFLQLKQLEEQKYLLRVVQVTHALKHSYKLEFVYTLLKNLKEINLGKIGKLFMEALVDYVT